MRRPDRSAFTLTETLVVLAIVAVLLAIVCPLFLGTRRRARTATCVSNLHQVWVGYSLAALDQGCELTEVVSTDTYPYLGGERVWRCALAESAGDRAYFGVMPHYGDAPPEPHELLLCDWYHARVCRWPVVSVGGSAAVRRAAPCL